MNLNDNIGNNIQRLRKERNVTQDILAAALEISVQAVSKWETGVSLPDIMQLPRIATFFGVSIDYLFYNEAQDESNLYGELPNDNTLRIVQFKGNKMLCNDSWEIDKYIYLKIPNGINDEEFKGNLNVEIWGNANIEGDISGYVECSGGLNCGNIGSYAECGGRLNCGNIDGYVECEMNMNCGNVGGYVECERLNCGNIGGNVTCSGDINCNIIKSQVECEGNIKCNQIQGDVTCEGDIIYKS